MTRFIKWVFILTVCSIARSETGIDSISPITQFYPQPIGLLYPGFNVAAGVNPAAIPSSGNGTAIQAGFSPAPSGGEAHRLFGSVAHKTSNFGFGAGYQGELLNGTLVHNAFVGLGANFGKFNVGLGLRDYNLRTGISPAVDVGLTIELKIIDFGVVFYSLETSPRIGVGIGTRSGSSFNLEANILLPPLNNLGSSYLATVSAQFAIQRITAYLRTTYDTGFRTLSHSVGLGGWVMKQAHLGAQYSTPNRIESALTVTF
jgi:hypothetical protein